MTYVELGILVDVSIGRLKSRVLVMICDRFLQCDAIIMVLVMRLHMGVVSLSLFATWMWLRMLRWKVSVLSLL